MLGLDLPTLLVLLPAVVVATTFHEYAHALVADRLGDPTPRRLGRLSLNPLVHLDVLGTLFFVLFRFGWAKPVPVDPRNFANPRQGMLQVALAGPLANITLAFAVGLLLKSQRVPDTLWVAAADMLCQDLRRKLTGERPSDRYFKDANQLADLILGGGFEAIAGVSSDEILMKYENK